MIHSPDESDIAMLTEHVCGECKYFELAEAQELMRAQRFVETLVREYEWKVEHLCSPINQLGLCGACDSGSGSAEKTITGRMHKECDQFRPANGGFSLRKAAVL